MANDSTHPVRFVTIYGVRYLRAEDIVKILMEVAGTEQTDTRNRLTELSKSLVVA